jgi:hypothetical protein
MKNRLEIPEELAHLLEKRELADRRAAKRSRDHEDDGPAKGKFKERRRGKDRRRS